MPAPQTLSEIRALLRDAGLSPQKRLGQNFLIDGNLMGKLLQSAELSGREVVLEVGSGTGSLTAMLLDAAARVIAVEIDRGLGDMLTDRLGDHPRLTLVRGDVLEKKSRLSPAVLEALRQAVPENGDPPAVLLVANLPYQVASPLLIQLLCCEVPFHRMCFAVQKEVAERIVARPGTRAYGPMSIALQTCARIHRIAQLPPQAFWPAPQVHSTALCLDLHEPPFADRPTLRAFIELVRGSFSHRRKTLHYNLRQHYPPAVVERACARAGLDAQARAETFPIERWQALFASLREEPRDESPES